MFLYARIYWLAEFGDVSCLQFKYLRVETLTPTWKDFVGHLSDNFKSEVRPESMIVDTLGGICSRKDTNLVLSRVARFYATTEQILIHSF
jgi:hypothetical protein